jgi:hypothetical protein
MYLFDNVTQTTTQMGLSSVAMKAKHVILPFLSVCIMLANGSLLYVLLLRRRILVHTLMNYFIVALACSDFLVGCPTIPLLVAAERQVVTSSYACLGAMCLAVVQTCASSLLLVAVGVERYIAILRPLHYHRLINNRRAVIGIIFCCGLAAIIGFLPLTGWVAITTERNITRANVECRFPLVFTGAYVAFIFVGFHYFMIVVMGFLYGRIIIETSKQLTRSCAMQSSSSRIALAATPTTAVDLCSKCRQKRHNIRVFRILSLLVCCYIVAWIPVSIFYMLTYKGFTINTVHLEDLSSETPQWLYPASVSMAFSNSAVNPVLYGFLNRSIRRVWMESVIRPLCCIRKAKNHRLVNEMYLR